MKSRFQATIGIQSQRGIYFGTTESIKGRIIQFSCPVELDVDEKVTLKIELPDGREWILADASIVRTAPSKRNETTRCMARISRMSTAHRERLTQFLKNHVRRPVNMQVSAPGKCPETGAAAKNGREKGS